MNLNLAKWELEILLDHKNKLKLEGRDLDYNEDGRITKLRNFLDSIDSVESKTESESKPETQESPF